MSIVEVKNLSKKYKDLTAVDGIFFDVQQGEIFGFLGPNGAGKSTTISMLATLVAPTGGQATINGYSIADERDEVRKSIGLVFQDPSLDERLTAKENLYFHAELYQVPKKERSQRIKEVLDLVDLWERKDNLVRTFSGGMKRRLEIARGLIHYPAVLFLDEPTLGLDPQTRFSIWEYILRLKKERGMTIFLTTHYMNEAEYCDRIAIIDSGKIVALDSPLNLKNMIGGDIICLTGENRAALKAELEQRYQAEVKEEGETVFMEVREGEKFLPRLFNEMQARINSIELRKPTLDDVFLNLTGKKIREEEASGKDLMRRSGRPFRR
ncbi:MAG: Daunorubicin resistance ABC transporter ATP-binding subunit [Parcubacteria group bacterium GW2011_GWC2_42_6]|nr:MAG: Daunorubicin resistance ABC transporter ATP-binding subunit [Parcubacteria group bacterium GW2011_GWA2_42_11]KKS66991.1 MAG: Daunorubicin resistance ABC transporter ATP-binding subunit [Parcubacteria group bacterium GW2011_GWC2_42_6]